MPNAELVFSQVGNDKKHINVVGRARSHYIENCGGVSCLTQNPMQAELIASATA